MVWGSATDPDSSCVSADCLNLRDRSVNAGVPPTRHYAR